MTARCANCGQKDHRYGTGDLNHDPDPMACINGLRHQIRVYRQGVRDVLAALEDDNDAGKAADIGYDVLRKTGRLEGRL